MGTDRERARLFDALLEEVADKGYEQAELGGALRRARLDRNGFEAEFADIASAVRTAHDAAITTLRDTAVLAFVTCEERWPRRVACALESVLKSLSRNPDRAEVLAAVLPGADREAFSRHHRFIEDVAQLLYDGRSFSPFGQELPVEVEMLAVGAAEAIIREETTAGRAAGLPVLGPQILFSLLVPFIGPDAATEEMDASKDLFDAVEVA